MYCIENRKGPVFRIHKDCSLITKNTKIKKWKKNVLLIRIGQTMQEEQLNLKLVSHPQLVSCRWGDSSGQPSSRQECEMHAAPTAQPPRKPLWSLGWEETRRGSRAPAPWCSGSSRGPLARPHKTPLSRKENWKLGDCRSKSEQKFFWERYKQTFLEGDTSGQRNTWGSSPV